jgi:DNA-binding MarR family transcriptional regulator
MSGVEGPGAEGQGPSSSLKSTAALKVHWQKKTKDEDENEDDEGCLVCGAGQQAVIGARIRGVMRARNSADGHRLPIDAPERRRLPLLLRRAWYGLNQAFRRRIAHLGVTPDQFTVMRTLLENEGVTQRELTELMSSDPNTVASLLERMETAGLVERQAHEKDRRAHRLRLKALGRRRYEAAREVAVAMQTEVLSALPEGAREKFLEELDAVAEACRVVAEKSPRRSGNRS